MTGMLSASVNIPQSSGGDEGEEYRVAQHRLDSAIESFRQAGIRVDGNVGDPDPIKAIGAYLRYREFDEIIVSTLPRGISRWLHQDLSHRIERKFHLPVAVITGPALKRLSSTPVAGQEPRPAPERLAVWPVDDEVIPDRLHSDLLKRSTNTLL
jgi:hypothetical protein